MLVQGKRFMALEDYQSATDSLEQAVQLYDAFYGVAKRECADAYLEYGLALVALANLEAGSGADKIMKKAGIEGGDEDEDEEEGDDDDDDDEDEGEGEAGDEEEEESEEQESKENGHSKEKTENDSTNGQTPMDTSQGMNGLGDEEQKKTLSTNADEQPQALPSSSSGSVPPQQEPTPGTSSGATALGDKDDEDVENEEATTIEIAWEVLCLAKRLFMTDESLDGRLKLAETLQKLGEISIEWDNNDNAVSILEECLNIRKAILPAEDRLIALTYYHLGLAHSFKSETQNANDNFQNAINVIEKRIETLTKDLEKAKESQDTIAVSAYEKEISELKELLPDMTIRMDDSKEDAVNSTEALKRTREELQQEDEEVKKVCLDKSKPVDDVSHLVKRKAA